MPFQAAALLILCVSLCAGPGWAVSASTLVSVGAIKPTSSAGSATSDGPTGPVSSQPLTFQPPAGQPAMAPGETVTQTIDLTFEPAENASLTQSSSLAVSLPDIPGYNFSCKLNGQPLTSALLTGNIKLEFAVQSSGETGILSGNVVATITAN